VKPGSHWKLLAALVLGAAAGAACNALGPFAAVTSFDRWVLQPLGQIFLRLIFMTVVPLVVSALILGVHELGRGAGLGRVAGRTLGWTFVASTASVVIGIALVNLVRPGDGFAVDPSLLREPAMAYVRSVLSEACLTEPAPRWSAQGGRQGVHSSAMGYLLAELQHLHRSHPGASW